ncbi:polysaccharide biosynthesis/export family protein [Tepidiphilus baoligensis]|uniref:Capsular biosynthesis protein n=1 Tax=Tepidiphilus baoligensis TaxID=2698687 RepID=A0ABX1QNN3_9PROT|nr:polysaccharide biosynthesis/export family protein [Tepidiphilus baoligensis]NMH17541.1 capsular biosynthesis protein [Tepidiphilus baoligensis]
MAGSRTQPQWQRFCFFWPLLLVGWLGGCALAPGLVMEPGSEEQGDVAFIPITDRLVYALSEEEKHKPSVPQELLEENGHPYRIGVNDSLMVTFWGVPEMMPNLPTVQVGGQDISQPVGTQVVQADGTIFVPYVGAIAVAGLTEGEARDKITAALKPILQSPQVDVSVVKFDSRHVTITGALAKPGRVALTRKPLTLAEAFGAAGGLTPQADASRVSLVRGDRIYQIDLDALQPLAGRVLLRDGDRVHVPTTEDKKIFVMGEVSKPTVIRYGRKSISLMEALGEANGVRQETASGREIYVIRAFDSHMQTARVVYRLEAASASKLALAGSFPLEPQDIVFVGPAQITRWNRLVSSFFPSLLFLTTADDLQN